MVVGTPPKRPAVFPIDLQNGQVVDRSKSHGHQSIIVEFPVFIAVRAIPVTRIIAPLVSETYGDPVRGKRPHFLDESVIQFLGPLAREESDDFISSIDELRAVPPS